MAVFDTITNLLGENPLLSGGGFLLAILGFAVTFFRKAIFYEYKQWREDDEKDDLEWYQKTASLARQVQRVWEGKYKEPIARGEAFSHDEVKAELGLLADQLDRHASKVSTNDVPPELVNMVYDTAQECRSTENCITGIGSNPEFEEQGKSAVKMAEELEESAEHRL